MRNQEKQRQSGCPIAFGLDTFGDRWTLLVVREMVFHGKKTFGDFLEIEEGIATNILADRLKHLEAEGIVTKARDPENRRSYTYALTPKGLDLVPVMLELVLWSGKHDKRPFARKDVQGKIKKDRKGFEKKLRQG